ncbi:extracellular solute-binding protein [Bacillus sp. FSL K6-3431]|uniref:extracellular solute-binding protein n=1 Tax=Bacillus sp. FSL K6-3431 TaxID=2921500 RepID=UPI0030F72744
MGRKFLVPIVFIMLLILGLLSACTGEESTKTGASKKEAGTDKNTHVMKIEVVGSGGGATPPDAASDFIKAGIDEALNTDINLNLFGSFDDYKSQLNIRMAGGDYPDLMQLDRTLLKEYAKKGLLLDLTPYLEELKPTIDFVGEDSILKATVDEGLYAIAKAPQIPYSTYWVRQDWLDALNMEVPATLDELFELAKAFTKKDPDGNGKADTYGFTGNGISTFEPIFGAYGMGSPGSFYIEDEKLMNSYFAPRMKEALSLINEMIEAGVVEPEIITNTGLQHQQKAFQGQAGIIYIDWPNMTKPEFVEQMYAVNSDAKWVQVKAFNGPGGEFTGSWDIGATPGMYGVPKALEKDPEKLKRIIELFNYVSHDEGANLVQYGIEGEHFNMEDGKPVLTELGTQELGYVWLYQFTGRPEIEYLEGRFKYAIDEMGFAANQPRIETLNGFINIPDSYNPGDADRYTEEETVKFLYGNRSLDEYDDFLETLNTTFNYETYTNSAEEQLKALGLVK